MNGQRWIIFKVEDNINMNWDVDEGEFEVKWKDRCEEGARCVYDAIFCKLVKIINVELLKVVSLRCNLSFKNVCKSMRKLWNFYCIETSLSM